MQANILAAFNPAIRAAIFQTLGVRESDLINLHGFENFVYALEQHNSILRISHSSHRDVDQLQAELDFLHYLNSAGAQVAAPKPVTGDRFLVNVGEFWLSCFEIANGQPITQNDWHQRLFFLWGKEIGRFHRLSKSYQPTKTRRLHWHADANFDFLAGIPSDDHEVRQQCIAYRQRLSNQSTDKDQFGLIHGDAHSGNFHFDSERLCFFDFDDCGYQWFAYDIATILFGAVLMPWIDNTREAQNQTAISFMKSFLSGYETENQLLGLKSNLAFFLKIRELSLYSVIHSHFASEALMDEYPKKFMIDRRRRIIADEPFIDVDFEAIL